MAQWRAGNDAAAEASFRAAVAAVGPGDAASAPAHVNLALLLHRRGAMAEAEAAYRAAIACDPACAAAHLNLGTLLAALHRWAEAQAACLRAAALDAQAAAPWSNLGALHAQLGDDAQAEWCYATALQVDAGHAQARFNLAILQLRHGRFDDGWPNLEARPDWSAGLAARMPCPRWLGEPLAGRSLLIGHEAGLGDMLQLCRYAAVLKSRGAGRVGILGHPALQRLLASATGIDRVIGLDAPVHAGDWDLWVPPFSVPGLVGTRIATIPAATPYLHADPQLQAAWAARLPAAEPSRLRVGLAWKGNPAFHNDAERSLPALAVLAPLWAVGGITFVSLQHGAGAGEAAAPPPDQPLLDIGSRCADLADAAAVIAQLDLVISVDTAVAHLAGALRRPCWLLLPRRLTDWRWLTERADSPWYPAMRLFRQGADGRWPPVVAAVTEALRQANGGDAGQP